MTMYDARTVSCDRSILSVLRARDLLRRGIEGGTMDESLIAKRLEVLRVEHRDLDSAIGALIGAGSLDQLQLARFKKRKLRLRDEIALLEDQLVPDIIA
ncbi:hypothetical protein D9M73_111850 [compost metagenome]|jgi:hypothetical protein